MQTTQTSITATAPTTAEIQSIPGISRIYRRESMSALARTDSKSVQYSRKQARDIFERNPGVDIVEYVATGNKSDSQYVGARGVEKTPLGVRVIICSTGGKWGKSRRDYRHSI